MSLVASRTCSGEVFQRCNYGYERGSYSSLEECVAQETLDRCPTSDNDEEKISAEKRNTQIKSKVNEIEYLQSKIARNKLIIGGVLLVVVGYFIIADLKYKA